VTVVAIAVGNTHAHVFATADDLVGLSLPAITIPEEVALDFFDDAGHRLSPGFDGDDLIGRLNPIQAAPVPQVVVARLAIVLANFRKVVDAHVDDLANRGITESMAKASLPVLDGTENLEDVLWRAQDALGHPDGDIRNALHNLLVHGIW
jgi:hypothetical protein